MCPATDPGAPARTSRPGEIDDPLLLSIGEAVDRLVTLDVMAYGVIGPLYAAARRSQGPEPLCLQVAALLAERCRTGATILLTTGLILPGHHPYGETDGPVGTAVLARALALGLGVRVLVATEPELIDLNAALLRTAGLQVIGSDALAAESGSHRAVAAIVPMSSDAAESREAARTWIDRFGISAVIAIESPGANASGVYHMVGGTDISASVGKGRELFEVAKAGSVLTIGIGDRGNELGMGRLTETTRDLLPKGRECGCGCGGGVADATPADLSLPAVVSNWGAYGVATCLAAILERPDLIQGEMLERSLFDTARSAGGIDGMSGRAILAVDGVGLAPHIGLVHLLAEIYRAQSARDPSPYSTPLIKAGSQVR